MSSALNMEMREVEKALRVADAAEETEAPAEEMEWLQPTTTAVPNPSPPPAPNKPLNSAAPQRRGLHDP